VRNPSALILKSTNRISDYVLPGPGSYNTIVEEQRKIPGGTINASRYKEKSAVTPGPGSYSPLQKRSNPESNEY